MRAWLKTEKTTNFTTSTVTIICSAALTKFQIFAIEARAERPRMDYSTLLERRQSVKQSSNSKSILIRSAIPGDEIDVARVHVRAWQVGYQGLLSDAYLTGLCAEDRAKRYTFGTVSKSHPKTLVATESGVIVGFATVFPAQDDDRTSPAELNALYVDPDCWKRGIGAALESAAGASLVQLGYRHAMLWVLAGNERAIGFYESQGWGTDGTSRQAEVWGTTVEEIRYVRSLDLSETGARVYGGAEDPARE